MENQKMQRMLACDTPRIAYQQIHMEIAVLGFTIQEEITTPSQSSTLSRWL